MTKFADIPQPKPQPRILLVDDEESILKIIGKQLEVAGFVVLKALDGEEALAAAKAQRPDLIVLDLMLPRRNGFDVCTTLKNDPEYRHIPIIIFTGKGSYGDVQLSRKCGADLYLSKTPVTARLISQIRSLLAKPSGP